MPDQIVLVHGRSTKPYKKELLAFWKRAIRHGLTRDFGGEAGALFDEAEVEMAYFGDISNAWLHRVRPDKYPLPHGDELHHLQVKGRERALTELESISKADFNSKSFYKKLPGQSGTRELLADIFSTPARWLGSWDWLVQQEAPDIHEYWQDGSDFGSSIRQCMIVPLKRAFDRAVATGSRVCIIGHSLGSVIVYDTLWKFSRYGEYRGPLTDDVDYSDASKFYVDLLMTIGSPLGDDRMLSELKGANHKGKLRYPANIAHWYNFHAEDDFVCHDNEIANDFSKMSKMGMLRSGIHDKHIYNLSVVPDGEGKLKSNPHHYAGYLMHPKLTKVLNRWLQS